jgi:hypothetical protein
MAYDKQKLADKMSDTKLKPCPFCGGPAKLQTSNVITCLNRDHCSGRMDNPKAATTWEQARIDLIANWNKPRAI